MRRAICDHSAILYLLFLSQLWISPLRYAPVAKRWHSLVPHVSAGKANSDGTESRKGRHPTPARMLIQQQSTRVLPTPPHHPQSPTIRLLDLPAAHAK